MKRFKFDKPLVESPTTPQQTNVYWVVKDGNSGKIAAIREYNAKLDKWENVYEDNTSLPTQVKEVSIDTRGQHTIEPDAGYAISKVIVDVTIPEAKIQSYVSPYMSGISSQGIDLTNSGLYDGASYIYIDTSPMFITRLDVSISNINEIYSGISTISDGRVAKSIKLTGISTSLVSNLLSLASISGQSVQTFPVSASELTSWISGQTYQISIVNASQIFSSYLASQVVLKVKVV